MTKQEMLKWVENYKHNQELMDMNNSLDGGWSRTQDENCKYMQRMLLLELIEFAGGDVEDLALAVYNESNASQELRRKYSKQ